MIDKAKTLKEIVSEEILEEVGYKVDPKDVHELSAAVAAAGVNGSTSHQFYAMVRKPKGGGCQLQHWQYCSAISCKGLDE